jgi:hydroxymethylbilane synthase
VTERIRVGTRRSRLAQAQTELVIARLRRAAKGRRFEPVLIDTSGDRDLTPGGSPDFTDAIDRALLRGEIDLAVHSAKDLPIELDRQLRIVAYPSRADPRDCLVVRRHISPARLPKGARIGSSSLRRRAQLLRWRPDLQVVEIRGNVDTRIGLVRSGAIDAVMLAVAGISRLQRRREIGRILPSTRFVPSPGQGALAVVARAEDETLTGISHRIDRTSVRATVTAERAFAAALGGDCRVPLGSLAVMRGRTLAVRGEVLSPDGRTRLCSRRTGLASRAEETGARLGEKMLDAGAQQLWAPSRT